MSDHQTAYPTGSQRRRPDSQGQAVLLRRRMSAICSVIGAWRPRRQVHAGVSSALKSPFSMACRTSAALAAQPQLLKHIALIRAVKEQLVLENRPPTLTPSRIGCLMSDIEVCARSGRFMLIVGGTIGVQHSIVQKTERAAVVLIGARLHFVAEHTAAGALHQSGCRWFLPQIPGLPPLVAVTR